MVQLRLWLQLASLWSDREGCAEGKVAIEIPIHLGGHHQVVIEAPKQGTLTGLRVPPEGIQGLLICQTLQVVKSVAHGFGGHSVEQSLQSHRAVHGDHPTTGAQEAAQRAVVDVMHPAIDAIAIRQQRNQPAVIVVPTITGVVLERQMV